MIAVCTKTFGEGAQTVQGPIFSLRWLRARPLIVFVFSISPLFILSPVASAADSLTNIQSSSSTANAGDTLQMSVDVKAPSGVNWINLILTPPSGGSTGFSTYFTLVSGSEQSGTWRMTFKIPVTGVSGVWTTSVGMQTKELTVIVAAGPNIAVTGSSTPTLSISNVKINRINANPGDTLQIFADIKSPTGVNWMNLLLFSPSGGSIGFSTYFSLVAGTEQSGTWSMSFKIPSTGVSGVWTTSVGMQDKELSVIVAKGPSIHVGPQSSISPSPSPASGWLNIDLSSLVPNSLIGSSGLDICGYHLSPGFLPENLTLSCDKSFSVDLGQLLASSNGVVQQNINLCGVSLGVGTAIGQGVMLNCLSPADKAAADKAAADSLAAQQAADKAIADAQAAQAILNKKVADALAAQQAAAKAKSTVLKKTTIICVKGSLKKTITAVKPVCPVGYKQK